MPSQDKLFLVSSVDSSKALTDLFDFVWPNAVALWNLQWQAKGFIAQMPTATVDDLNSRFVLGSGIRGANLHRLADKQIWPEMQQWFARLLLSETCALFEGWIEAALDELALPDSIRKTGIDKNLQFPTDLNSKGDYCKGVWFAISKIQGVAGSPFIQTCFLPTLQKNKKNSSRFLDKLLICYRAFKEVRNDFTHHGGRASKRAEQAFLFYQNETAVSLGLKEKPEFPSVIEGNPILLSLRGVVGLSDVMLRLIATLDCLLCDSTHAEGLLKTRWLKKHKGLVTVKAAGEARNAQLIRRIQNCGLPRPVDPLTLYDYLSSKRLAV